MGGRMEMDFSRPTGRMTSRPKIHSFAMRTILYVTLFVLVGEVLTVTLVYDLPQNVDTSTRTCASAISRLPLQGVSSDFDSFPSSSSSEYMVFVVSDASVWKAWTEQHNPLLQLCNGPLVPAVLTVSGQEAMPVDCEYWRDEVQNILVCTPCKIPLSPDVAVRLGTCTASPSTNASLCRGTLYLEPGDYEYKSFLAVEVVHAPGSGNDTITFTSCNITAQSSITFNAKSIFSTVNSTFNAPEISIDAIRIEMDSSKISATNLSMTANSTGSCAGIQTDGTFLEYDSAILSSSQMNESYGYPAIQLNNSQLVGGCLQAYAFSQAETAISILNCNGSRTIYLLSQPVSQTLPGDISGAETAGSCDDLSLPAGLSIMSSTFSDASIHWIGDYGVEVTDCVFINSSGLVEANPVHSGQSWQNILLNSSNLTLDTSFHDTDPCIISGILWTGNLTLEEESILTIIVSGSVVETRDLGAPILMSNLQMNVEEFSLVNITATVDGNMSRVFYGESSSLEGIQVLTYLPPSIRNQMHAIELVGCCLHRSCMTVYLENDPYGVHTHSNVTGVMVSGETRWEDAHFTVIASGLNCNQLQGITLHDIPYYYLRNGSLTVDLDVASLTQGVGVEMRQCFGTWWTTDVTIFVSTPAEFTGFRSLSNKLTLTNVNTSSQVMATTAVHKLTGIWISGGSYSLLDSLYSAHVSALGNNTITSSVGLLVMEGTVTVQGFGQFIGHSSMAGSQGIVWSSFLIKDSPNGKVLIEGVGDSIGVNASLSQWNVGFRGLILNGTATDYGVRLDGMEIQCPMVTLTGDAQVGLTWPSLDVETENAIWLFVATSTGSQAISAGELLFTSTGNSTFMIGGSGTATFDSHVHIQSNMTIGIPLNASSIMLTTTGEDSIRCHSLFAQGNITLSSDTIIRTTGPSVISNEGSIQLGALSEDAAVDLTLRGDPIRVSCLNSFYHMNLDLVATVLHVQEQITWFDNVNITASQIVFDNDVYLSSYGRFLLHSEQATAGNLTVNAIPFLLEDTHLTCSSLNLLSTSTIGADSLVQGRLMFRNESAQLLIDGTVNGTVSLSAGTLMGFGYIETLDDHGSTDPTTSIVRPQRGKMLHIGGWQGVNVTYAILVGTSQSSQISLRNRTDPLYIDITFSGWSGGLVYPIVMSTESEGYRFRLKQQELSATYFEGDEYITQDVTAVISWLYESGGNHTLSLHENHPPHARPLNETISCTPEDCSIKRCYSVIENGTDPDIHDNVTIVEHEWPVEGEKICFSRAQNDSNTLFRSNYTISDGHVNATSTITLHYLIPSPSSTTSVSPSCSISLSYSSTGSSSGTSSPTHTISHTPSVSHMTSTSPSASESISSTPSTTSSRSPSASVSLSHSPSGSSSVTSSRTPSPSITSSPSASESISSTPSSSPTSSTTSSGSFSKSISSSRSPTGSSSGTCSQTPSQTISNTSSASTSATPTSSTTSSVSPSQSIFLSHSPTRSSSGTSSHSQSPTVSNTPSVSHTISASPSASDAISYTPSATPSDTRSASASATPTPSTTPSRSPSTSVSLSHSPSGSSSVTSSRTPSPSITNSSSASESLSSTPSSSPTSSTTSSGSFSKSISSSRSPTGNSSGTCSRTSSHSISNTPSASDSISSSPSHTPTSSNSCSDSPSTLISLSHSSTGSSTTSQTSSCTVSKPPSVSTSVSVTRTESTTSSVSPNTSSSSTSNSFPPETSSTRFVSSRRSTNPSNSLSRSPARTIEASGSPRPSKSFHDPSSSHSAPSSPPSPSATTSWSMSRSPFTGILLPPEVVPSILVTRGPMPSPSTLQRVSTSEKRTRRLSASRSALPAISVSCMGCSQGYVQVPISQVQDPYALQTRSATPTQVSIVLGDGQVVGSIIIPPQLTLDDPSDDIILSASSTTIDRAFQQVNDGHTLGSAVTNITLLSANQGSISQLNQALTICLEATSSGSQDQCLGYYDEVQQEWTCEDRCLSHEGNSYCGKTDHLTSFALLLGGGNRKCKNGKDVAMGWMSVAFAVGALIIVTLSVLAIETYFRVRKIRKLNFLRTLSMETRG